MSYVNSRRGAMVTVVMMGALWLQWGRAAGDETIRPIGFAERVMAQRAIESVYYSHQIGSRRDFERAVTEELLEKKVRAFQTKSVMLREQRHITLSRADLRRELERISTETRFPARLLEVLEALGHDEDLILECFVRPVLLERKAQELAKGLHDGNREDGTIQKESGDLKNVVSDPMTTLEPGGCSAPAEAWLSTSTSGAPSERAVPTVVWTGNQMIVWGGGLGDLSTGSRYDPLVNAWAETSQVNVPHGRSYHTAVWTGDEMIIWGGFWGGDIELNDGARYDPISDTWQKTSSTGAPARRHEHTAVWTGNEMIVWGGYQGSTPQYYNSGGRYDPLTDTWTATSTADAPQARSLHTAVWTGSRMFVWGGEPTVLQTGGLYDPATNSWMPTSLVNAPSVRREHTAVWTGKSVLIWGGNQGTSAYLNTGGSYDPVLDSWTVTSVMGAPIGRRWHTAVWTGAEMVVWGGQSGTTPLSSGGRYDPDADAWIATSLIDVPEARSLHVATWTGAAMVVWGGIRSGAELDTGGRYMVGPGEIRNVRWRTQGGPVEWDADPAGPVLYDIMFGSVGELSNLGTSTTEECLADDTASTSVADSSPGPAPGQAWYFLVRGANSVGAGTYGCSSGGSERVTAACP